MIRTIRRPLPLLALLLLLLIPTVPAAAQEPFGVVAGRALDEGGAPVPLSLVRLEPGAGGEGRSVLTDTAGAFRFDSVAPGEYRLRLERIGYTAAPTPPFAVAAGAAVEQTLRAALRPVALARISARGDACYTGERLHEAPDLEALWREAQKGAETRRGFHRQYAYRYDLRIRGIGHLRLLRDKRVEQDSTVYTHPDSVRAREAEHRATRAREGFGRQGRSSLEVRVPNELELLEDDFLTTHCLEAAEQEADGAWTLRFRPVAVRRGVVDIRGALRVDGGSFAVRELEFEYLRGGRPWGQGTVVFSEVQTPFGPVRLPARGTLRGDPGGTLGLLLTSFEGTFTIGNFRDFERVGS